MEKHAVIYTRVSDPSQIDNNSLASQKNLCEKFAKSQGYIVDQEFREEGVSAKHINTRPQLRELVSFVTKKSNNISAVIVYKYDRFSRNLEEGLATIGLLAKHKVIVISATENTDQTPMGIAMRNIMMTLGQLDNELKGERVKHNMQAVFRSGLWPFKPPVGYTRRFKTKEENKGLPPIQNPNLAPIITKMFENASTGIYNKSQLARMMNLDGFEDYYKVKANHKIVRNILIKPFYYGRMYAPKWEEYSQGLHKPLTDEKTWQKAYHLLVLKKKSYNYQDVELYPLKGALKCGKCKHPMTTSPSRGNTSMVYYYECKNKNCTKLRINASKAHDQFEKILSNIEPTRRVIKMFQHLIFREWDKVINETKQQSKSIEDKVISLKEELKSIRKAKDDGLYTKEQAKEEASEVQKEIVLLNLERSELKIEQYSSEIVKDFMNIFLSSLVLLWDSLDLPKRQAFLQKIFLGTILCTVDKEIRTLDLSPSFQLIQQLDAESVQKVPPPGIEPGAAA